MTGEAVNGVDLFGGLKELVGDVGKQATSRGKDAVEHVGKKLSVRLGKAFGNFVRKR